MTSLNPPFLTVASPLNVDWALAEAAIKRGRTVIVDSARNYDALLDRGTELAQRYGCDYFYIECQSSADERLRNRVLLRSQRTCVDSPPRGADDAHRAEDTDALFEKCHPKNNCIVVDPTVSLEKRSGFILERISRPTDVQTSNVAAPEPDSLKGGLAA
ncbi:hypothetical protein BGW80DRAFT_65277 [Lactifluus volemus]|nr:hypothetical protein BGW80DRAFT_65277 [Lactifluus volemus]